MPTDPAEAIDPDTPDFATEAEALNQGPPPYTFDQLAAWLLARGVPQYALDAVQTIQLTTTPAPSSKDRGASVQVVAMVTYYPSPSHQDLGADRGETLYHSNYWLLHA